MQGSTGKYTTTARKKSPPLSIDKFNPRPGTVGVRADLRDLLKIQLFVDLFFFLTK